MGAYTGDFALVCEGITDFAVLKNILIGYFKEQREPIVVPNQPVRDATGDAEWQRCGNWENVFRYLREKKHRDALQFNQFLVVQVDTDVSEHPNFAVPQLEHGIALSPDEMVLRVSARIREIIGPDDCHDYNGRLIFAICVREMECWLLPLWDDSKAAKITGCLDALNAALARANEPTINPNDKKPAVYENASREYRKRRELLDEGVKNPSLKFFLADLDARNIQLATDD